MDYSFMGKIVNYCSSNTIGIPKVLSEFFAGSVFAEKIEFT